MLDEDGSHAIVLDKNGRQVSDAVVRARLVDGNAATALFAVSSNGRVFHSNPSGPYAMNYRQEMIAGKPYVIDSEGIVPENTLVEVTYGSSSWLVYAGKNGVLTTNAFVKLKMSGFTYSAWFDGNGRNNPASKINGKDAFYVNGKLYAAILAVDDEGREVYVVCTPPKAGWDEVFGFECYLNKDGTVKTGWITGPSGEKMYALIDQNYPGNYRYSVLKALYKNPYDSESVFALYRIDGKTYLFDKNGAMKTGWVNISGEPGAYILSVSSGGSVAWEDWVGGLCYFDPKTGAMYTGGWKNVNVPATFDGELSYSAEQWNINSSYARPVNASAKKAKLYFNANGSLLRDTQMMIGGKNYVFAADGTASIAAGWLNSEKRQYVLKNGQLATGRQLIDGQYYYFNSYGYKETNVLRKSSGKWYFYGLTGAQTTRSMGLPDAVCEFRGLSTSLPMTAIWNKDGSLAKIVYTGTGTPAAGETVVFGWRDNVTFNGCYMLDSKGLPVTGLITGFRTGNGSTCGMILNADGSRVMTGDQVSLMPYGKKIYAVRQGLILSSGEANAEDWSLLSAEDQKTMNFAAQLGLALYGDLRVNVVLNADGSVAANDCVYWHGGWCYTNRLGVPMNHYCPVFKYGGKWYTNEQLPNGTVLTLYPVDAVSVGHVQAVVRTKTNGELTGFYNRYTGEALTGTYVCEDEELSAYLFLKSGKPQPSAGGLDPQFGVYPIYGD